MALTAPTPYTPLQNVEAGQLNYNPITYDATGSPIYNAPDSSNQYFNNVGTNQANQQYNSQFSGLYNNINNLYNNFLTNQQDATKQFDASKEQAKTANRTTQQGFSNNMLSRGLGTSSLVTTGLAGIGLEGEKTVNDLETSKNDMLNKLLMGYNQDYGNFQNNLQATEAERQAAIRNYAQQEYEKAYGRGRDQYGDAYNIWQDKQNAAANSYSSGYGGGGYSSGGSGGSSKSSGSGTYEAQLNAAADGGADAVRGFLYNSGYKLREENPELYAEALAMFPTEMQDQIKATKAKDANDPNKTAAYAKAKAEAAIKAKATAAAKAKATAAAKAAAAKKAADARAKQKVVNTKMIKAKTIKYKKTK